MGSIDGRVDVRKIDATNRPRNWYSYFVTGHGEFPFDMLRHDSAWPARGEDAARLVDPDRKTRSVKLYSYREPTIDRWTSFNWSVGFAAVVGETV